KLKSIGEGWERYRGWENYAKELSRRLAQKWLFSKYGKLHREEVMIKMYDMDYKNKGGEDKNITGIKTYNIHRARLNSPTKNTCDFRR
ncbi:MAG: hypothetical protein KAJ09_08040, partial [Deltaproteobacteria bacterium]|nr:hypothetical protein [Deltaproteobacteria bacterium]